MPSGGRKKHKKNGGNKGGKNLTAAAAVAKAEKRELEKVKVGDVISLAEIEKKGVEINLVSNHNQTTKNVNNNITTEEQKTKTTESLQKIEKSSKSEKDLSAIMDESGYQEEEANSSLMDKSSSSSAGKKTSVDLNEGFLTSSDVPDLLASHRDNVTEKHSSGRGGNIEPARNMTAGDMTAGDMTIQDFVQAGVPHYIAVMKHPLQNQWTFWYQKNDPSVNWDAQMKPIVDVETVEDFWQVYHYLEPASNLQEGQDYSLFKKGIFPDWSDFQNMKGGRWIINMEKKEQYYEQPRVRKERLESMWMELLLVLIGEQAEDHAQQVNGVTVNVKKRADRLSIWLRKANDMAGVMYVGRLVKNRLNLGFNKMYFQGHEQASGVEKERRKNSSNNSPQKIFI